MATVNQTPRVAPKANGNGNGATVAPAPKKTRAKRVAKGKSSTPMPVIKAKKPSAAELKAAKYNEMGLTPLKEVKFKASDMVAMDSATASKNITLLRQTGSKAKAIAHKTACGILLHYVATGDWSKLTALDHVIGEVWGGAKQRAFREWVGTFSSVKYDAKKKAYFDSVKGQGADAKYFTLTAKEGATADSPIADKGALNTAFYSGEHFGDSPDHTFDFEKAFAAFAQRVTRELALRKELIDKKQKAKAKKIDIDEKQASAVLSLAKTLHINLEAAKTAGNA